MSMSVSITSAMVMFFVMILSFVISKGIFTDFFV